jgi:hypothetical protein
LRSGRDDVSTRSPAGVDGEDDGLRSEAFGNFGDELGARDGGGVESDLVGAGIEESSSIGERANTSADGEGYEEFTGGATDGIEQDRPGFAGGGDVKQDNFVGSGLGMTMRKFGRIAGIDQVDELNALYDATVSYVEAGDDALGQHATSQKFLRI